MAVGGGAWRRIVLGVGAGTGGRIRSGGRLVWIIDDGGGVQLRSVPLVMVVEVVGVTAGTRILDGRACIEDVAGVGSVVVSAVVVCVVPSGSAVVFVSVSVTSCLVARATVVHFGPVPGVVRFVVIAR